LSFLLVYTRKRGSTVKTPKIAITMTVILNETSRNSKTPNIKKIGTIRRNKDDTILYFIIEYSDEE
jgi:CRISPR/Cas system CSM-associated protein Csm4 (group 5 of RAMP superfamily)